MKNAKSKGLSSLIFIPLILLIFLRPFFSGLLYPIVELYYENCIIFLALITLLTNRNTLAGSHYLPPIFLLLAAYLISTLTSVNIQNSFKEIIMFISCFSLFFMVSRAGDKQRKALIKTIVIAASIISVYSIYQYFWGYQGTLDYLKKINSDFLSTSSYAKDILIAKRAIGTFPSPNILGGYLIAVFFISLSLIKNGAMHKKWLLSPFLIIIALILTKSMGAWLSLIIAFAFLLFFSRRSLEKRKLILVTSSILIALVITFIILNRWDRLMDLENPQNSIIQRLNYWRTAIAVIKDHPFTGVRPGNFQEVFLDYKAGMSTDTRFSHNIFLHQWSETGVPGFIGILLLISIFIIKAGSKSRYLLLAGLAFILHNLIDNTYFIPQVGLFWWIIIGLASERFNNAPGSRPS